VKMLSDQSICNSKRFIEIGCGSGAICVSLLKQLPLVSDTAVLSALVKSFAVSQSACPHSCLLLASQFDNVSAIS